MVSTRNYRLYFQFGSSQLRLHQLKGTDKLARTVKHEEIAANVATKFTHILLVQLVQRLLSRKIKLGREEKVLALATCMCHPLWRSQD